MSQVGIRQGEREGGTEAYFQTNMSEPVWTWLNNLSVNKVWEACSSWRRPEVMFRLCRLLEGLCKKS